MLVDIGLKFYAVPCITTHLSDIEVNVFDLVAKHKSGELRCPATALIIIEG